jgi:hypothetical protein
MVKRLIAVMLIACAASASAVSKNDIIARISAAGEQVDLTADLWHFWNPGGGYNTNDIGSKPQHVTLNGGLTSTTNGWEMGTNDNVYATIPNGISNGAAFALCAWVRPDTANMNLNLAGGYIFADRAPSTAPGGDFQLSYNPTMSPSNYMLLAWKTTNSFDRLNNVSAIMPMVWQHIAAVKDAASLNLYINGVLSFSTNATATQNNQATNAMIGNASWGAGPNTQWHGDIDKVRFYGTSKPASFIQALYNAEKASKGL